MSLITHAYEKHCSNIGCKSRCCCPPLLIATLLSNVSYQKHRWHLIALGAILLPSTVFAATRTWDGGGADNKWSTAANWSSDTVPKGGDIILFDGTGKKNSTVDAAFGGSGAELQITSSNTGTITVERALTINGNLFLSGGTLTINGGKTVTVKGGWQNGGGTLTSNTGTVLFSGSGTSYVIKETGVFKNLSIDDGLVGHWRFDEGSGIALTKDSSRQANHATLYNFTSSNWTTSTPSALTGFSNPYAFTSAGGPYAQITDNVSLNPQRITISAWANPSIDNGCNTLWEQSNQANNRLIYGFVTPATFNWELIFTDAVTVQLGASATSALNTWTNVAVTYDGTTARLYINGTLSASYAKTGTLRYGGSNPHLRLGIVNGGYCPWIGKMDDVRIYNRALSHSEIQSLYAGNASTGSGKYTLGSGLTVNGNLNIYSGTLDASASNHAITASGSFTNNAGFTPRAGTVTLNGIGTSLKMYGTSLYNLTIAAAKSAILRTAAVVSNVLTVNTSSTLNLNGNTLTATTAVLTNNGTLTQGTGALINRNTSLSVSPSSGAIGATITITLTDADANTNGTVAETVTVGTDAETITLTETGNATGVFTGTLPTMHGERVSGNGIVERNDACTFVTGVYYTDPEDANDTASATFTLTNGAVTGCSANGSGDTSASRGGGSKRSGVPLLVTTPALAKADRVFQSTGNAEIDTRIKNLERRTENNRSKLTMVSGRERERLKAVIHLIEFVIERLRARG